MIAWACALELIEVDSMMQMTKSLFIPSLLSSSGLLSARQQQ